MKQIGLSTTEVNEFYNLSGTEYRTFGPWLEKNGFTLDDLPLTAKNEYGEDVIIERTHDSDNGFAWELTTVQDNGWIRINTYYKDGSTEEYYRH